MISIVSNNMIRFNIKSIAEYMVPQNKRSALYRRRGDSSGTTLLRGGNLALDASG